MTLEQEIDWGYENLIDTCPSALEKLEPYTRELYQEYGNKEYAVVGYNNGYIGAVKKSRNKAWDVCLFTGHSSGQSRAWYVMKVFRSEKEALKLYHELMEEFYKLRDDWYKKIE